jgi:hypothetical protein
MITSHECLPAARRLPHRGTQPLAFVWLAFVLVVIRLVFVCPVFVCGRLGVRLVTRNITTLRGMALGFRGRWLPAAD